MCNQPSVKADRQNNLLRSASRWRIIFSKLFFLQSSHLSLSLLLSLSIFLSLSLSLYLSIYLSIYLSPPVLLTQRWRLEQSSNLLASSNRQHQPRAGINVIIMNWQQWSRAISIFERKRARCCPRIESTKCTLFLTFDKMVELPGALAFKRGNKDIVHVSNPQILSPIIWNSLLRRVWHVNIVNRYRGLTKGNSWSLLKIAILVR